MILRIRTVFYVLAGLHVACAIVGFGSIAISGAYGSIGREVGRSRSFEEARRYFSSRNWPEYLVVAVPFFGAAALAAKPRGDFAQLWVGGALAVWVLALGVLFAVVRPCERLIRETLVAVPAGGADAVPLDAAAQAEVRRAGTRLAWGSAATDVAFFVALMLMVFRPS